MRKILIWFGLPFGLVIGLAMIGFQAIGMSPISLYANLAVGTGMGAKLACSGRFLSGFTLDQIRGDLASYSPAIDWFSIDLDDQAKRATVDLLGFSRTSATYRDGIGCTIDDGSPSLLDGLEPPVRPPLNETEVWPAGPRVPALDSRLVDTLNQSLAQDHRQGLETRALIMVQGGRILAEAYAPGIMPNTPLMGWSLGKSLTSLMLGWLEKQGQVSVSENDLFPQWAEDERVEITVKNLLQMSSGLDFEERYSPGSDATRMLFIDKVASKVPLESAYAYAAGEHFYYSSGTTNLLTLLFNERVGGPQNALNRLYKDILWPMGMRHTTLEPDANGVFVGSSNIYASARDWARLGEVFLRQGEINGIRIASESYMRAATQPNTSTNSPAYGYQVWLNHGGESLRWPDLPADAYAFTGNRGQVVMVIPSLDSVLVRLGWSASYYPRNERFAAWLRAASGLLDQMPSECADSPCG